MNPEEEADQFLERGRINSQRESDKPSETTLDEKDRRLMLVLGALEGAAKGSASFDFQRPWSYWFRGSGPCQDGFSSDQSKDYDS